MMMLTLLKKISIIYLILLFGLNHLSSPLAHAGSSEILKTKEVLETEQKVQEHLHLMTSNHSTLLNESIAQMKPFLKISDFFIKNLTLINDVSILDKVRMGTLEYLIIKNQNRLAPCEKALTLKTESNSLPYPSDSQNSLKFNAQIASAAVEWVHQSLLQGVKLDEAFFSQAILFLISLRNEGKPEISKFQVQTEIENLNKAMVLYFAGMKLEQKLNDVRIPERLLFINDKRVLSQINIEQELKLQKSELKSKLISPLGAAVRENWADEALRLGQLKNVQSYSFFKKMQTYRNRAYALRRELLSREEMYEKLGTIEVQVHMSPAQHLQYEALKAIHLEQKELILKLEAETDTVTPIMNDLKKAAKIR